MKTLMQGYARFRGGYWRRHKAKFSDLARNGQAPPAMVIACADDF
jgi:carbonic anhydrase